MQSSISISASTQTKVAVVGAGTMGSSIAVALLGSGFGVLLKETEQAFLDKGLANIDRLFASRMKKGLSAEEVADQKSRLETTLSYEHFSEVDFVIEAAPENLEIKKQIFQELDQWCHVDAILATNTSSLSITQIANFVRRADKVVGLHFFNPAHIMKLVEVIPGLETSHDTVARALDLARSMGKLAVRVEECASFLVNRLLGRYMNESLFQLQNGASVEEIDKAVCDFVMPIGPLALRDMNGADIGLAVAKYNYQEYGARFAVPPILEAMVQKNLLGQKTMGGFYCYDPETRKRTTVNTDFLKTLQALEHEEKVKVEANNSFTAERLFLPMINEAFLAMQERICQPEDLDAALMAGLGMRKGPLTLASEIGLAHCLAMLEEAGASSIDQKERFRPAPLLKRFVWAGRSSVL